MSSGRQDSKESTESVSLVSFSSSLALLRDGNSLLEMVVIIDWNPSANLCQNPLDWGLSLLLNLALFSLGAVSCGVYIYQLADNLCVHVDHK